jgi:hypothetical protein
LAALACLLGAAPPGALAQKLDIRASTMDTYGRLFEGSDHDSAEKMEKLFAERRAHKSDRPSSESTTPKAVC